MKKLLLLIFCIVFLIGNVSSADFDDVKYYDEETKTYTLENFFGLGKHITDLELKTPQMFKVPRGYQKIAEIEIKNGEYDYEEIINGIELYNIRNNLKEVIRNIDYKYKTIKNVSIDDYNQVCEKSVNGTEYNCYSEKIGNHLEEREVWEDFTKNSLLKGEVITLGIFTEVQKGDNIEWVINVYGNERLTKWAVWTESIEVGLVAYYMLEETSGAVLDYMENFNGDNFGATREATGIIDNAFDFEESDSPKDYVRINASGIMDSMSLFTTSFWFKPESIPQFPVIIAKVNPEDENDGWGCELADDPDVIMCEISTGSGKVWYENCAVTVGQWTNIILTYNGTTGFMYCNNTLIVQYDQVFGDTTEDLFLGARLRFLNDANRHFDGIIDEVGLWNRSLSVAEVNDLWNGGAGINPTILAPTVNVTLPLNITYNETQTQLNYTVDALGDRCWYSTDGGTTNSSDNDCTANFTGLSSVANLNTWIVYSNTSYGFLGQDSVTFTVASGMIINLISPINTLNSTNATIDFNCNATDLTQLINLTLVLNGVENATNTTAGLSMTLLPTLTLADGDYNWTCRAWDNDDFVLTSPVRTFTIDTEPEIYVISPTNTTYTTSTIFFNATSSLAIDKWIVDYNGTNITLSDINTSLTVEDGFYHLILYANNSQTGVFGINDSIYFNVDTTPPNINILFPNETFSLFVLGNNLTLNWSITTPGFNSTVHVKNCSYTYNSVRVDLNTTTCTIINETSFLYVDGVNDLSMRVYDIFNNTATNITTWAIKILEINQTFNNETIEGATEQFILNTSILSGLQISLANIIYNGTSNVGTSVIQGGYVISTASVIIPNIVADINVTFNWNITLSDSTQVSLTSNNQTIRNLVIDNCTTGTTLIFNYTMVDEGNQSKLGSATNTTTTFEVDLDLFSLDRTTNVANFSRIYNDINPATICININLTNGTAYSVDSIVRYIATNYANEYYNIQNFTMQNSTIPQVITLFDLFSSDSTEFQITFKDLNFVPVENALVQINRQYISEGVFKTVEIPKTDSNGQTVAHLVEKEVIYNILVIKNGVILGTFNNIIAFCEDVLIGSCFISLNALEANIVVFDYDDEIGLISSFDYNQTTKNLQFDFTTTDGSVKNISLSALKVDQLGNNTVCTTSLLSAAGSLFCTVPDSVGNETIIVSIFVDGDLRITNYIKAGRAFDIGDAGYFLMFFLVLSLTLMMTESKTAVIIGVVLGFITSILLSFVQGGLLGIGSSFIWLIIVAIILIWKLNSQKQT